MKPTLIIGDALPASAIALGCMRVAGMTDAEAARRIETALEAGVSFFDHADIYGAGEAETKFAAAVRLAKIPRHKMTVQIKCGIRKSSFDFSKEHILSAAEGCLNRLETDYADTLLLHRPDTLMEPEDVAEAFDKLYESGKVRHFGVSNHNPGQIRLLQKYIKQPLVINQLQFSLAHTGMIDSGLNVNMKNPPSVDHDGGVLEFCRLKGITIQAWSPFQYGFFDGPFIGSEKFPALNGQLKISAKNHGVTAEAVAIAWILRHPAHIQPIVGTTNPERVKAIAEAYRVEMPREEWYALYCAAGNELP
jgi:predicted oxidoreductase